MGGPPWAIRRRDVWGKVVYEHPPIQLWVHPETLAKQFPDELASRLPPKRKIYKSEDSRMDTFDAVGLAVALKTLT
jgi:hypothetical protein